MKKGINIIKAFEFGIKFVKNNLKFLFIPFLLYTTISIIDSFIMQISIEGNFTYLYLSINSNIMHYSLNKNFPLPSNGLLNFVPISYGLLLVLYILVNIIGSYTYIVILNRVISWKNKIENHHNKDTINKISISLICKVFLASIIFGGIVYLWYLPNVYINITRLLQIKIIDFLSVFLAIFRLPGLFIGIYFMVSFYFFAFLIIDQNYSIVNSFKRSFEITKNNKLHIFSILILLGMLNNVLFLLFNKLISFIKMPSIFIFIFSIIVLSLIYSVLNFFAIGTIFHAYRQLSDN